MNNIYIIIYIGSIKIDLFNLYNKNIELDNFIITNKMDDFEEEEDYIEPIPSVKQNLIYGDDESIEEYERKIKIRTDLDAEMKQVMILTRREFMNISELDEFDSNNNSVDRASNIVNFVNKINQIIKINKTLGNKLKNKLTDYISCKIELIILDVETFIEYDDIIKNFELDPNTLEHMSKIIIPDNIQLLDEYKQIFKQSKKDWENDQEKIREQEEKNKIIIEHRIKITQSLMLKIIKISNYDTEAKELESILSTLFDKFDKYNKLISNSVDIEQDILDKIVKFINKSRFTEQEKNDILNIFI